MTTYKYQVVNIRTGAKIPDPTRYLHLHLGVWAGLNEADKIGTNTLADLGIGFVAGLSDMSAVMPNFGGADYEGNWVANIQEKDDDGNGDITRHDGLASMDADFVKGTVEVMLMGLAELDGTIDGNTFSGMEAATLLDSDITTEDLDGAGGLAADGKFEGNFSGAFFGPLAVARFRAMLIRDPTLPRVRLDLALAYFRAEEDSSAAYHFRQVLGDEDLPPVVRARTLAFLDTIRRRKTWSVSAAVALAPDSNINAATSSREVNLFGLPAQLSEDARQTSGVGLNATYLGGIRSTHLTGSEVSDQRSPVYADLRAEQVQ